MKTSAVVALIGLLGAAGAAGYWLGARAPVVEGAAASVAAAGSAPQAPKLLYYRNPMGLPDTSPTPKKDPMGMDYIAVYEGEDEPAAGAGPTAPNALRISTDKIQKLGVRTEPAQMRMLGKVVRAAGRVEPDERLVAVIAPKFEGYIEKLHVNATGQQVSRGQALFEAYSPEMLSAQREYVIAAQGLKDLGEAGAEARDSMKQLAESSLAHLRHWDWSSAQVAALVKSGQPQRTLSYTSPVTGIVTEKKALQGMRFMPGEMLYQVTDLSAVWVIADLSEQDIGFARTGAKARVTTTAYPNEVFEGRVTYVYPTMRADTRTIPVRVEMANPGHRLKPSMFAQVELSVGAKAAVLTVPDSAVIDSGTRRVVLVQVEPGRFEPREVELGARGEHYIEIVKGVKDGEQVVVAANFLIDAESNLKAAIGGLGAAAGQGGAAAVSGAPGTAPPATVGHKAEGRVDGIDLQAGTLSLEHGPVATLKWPAMTMEFKAANSGLLAGLKQGQSVKFEFVERAPGEYVVTAIDALAPATVPRPVPRTKPEVLRPAAPASDAHSGH